MIKGFISKWILLLLLIGAIVCWLSTGLVFMQDELSALSRLRFNSFRDFIEFGVKADFHPALVQFFLYGWTYLFGTSEFAVKLPAMLCGIGSMVLAYRISSGVYNRITGLILVAFVAFSQYYILYFTLARPYAFGTLFILAQIYILLRWKDREAKERRLMAWFVVISACAAWTHYFSLVAAGLVAIWGFFWLDPKHRKGYLLSCLFALMLYSPHLPITLHQLGKGGVGGEDGWLRPPQVNVWWDYFRYLGQYTIVGGLVLLGSFLLSLKRWERMSSAQRSFFVLGMVLMFVPFSLAFFYSYAINPVFQFSILIFGSIPFLWVIFSGFTFTRPLVGGLMLALVMTSCIMGTFVFRKHDQVMAYQPFDDIAHQVKALNAFDRTPIVLSNMNPNFLDLYNVRMNLEYGYVQVAHQTLEELRKVTVGSSDIIAQVGGPKELPYMLNDMTNAQIITRPTYDLLTSFTWSDELVMLPSLDSLTQTAIEFEEGQEYGHSFEMRLDTLPGYPSLNLLFSQVFITPSELKGTLIVELYAGDEQVLWRGTDIDRFSVIDGIEHRRNYLALSLQDLDEKVRKGPLKVSCYYWNSAKQTIHCYPIRLRVYPDLTHRNGLFEEF